MARKPSKTLEQRIAEIEAKIERKTKDIKKLKAIADGFRAKALEEEFSELNTLIKKKNVDVKKVIEFVNSL